MLKIIFKYQLSEWVTFLKKKKEKHFSPNTFQMIKAQNTPNFFFIYLFLNEGWLIRELESRQSLIQIPNIILIYVRFILYML
jgi:hypothetical protein